MAGKVECVSVSLPKSVIDEVMRQDEALACGAGLCPHRRGGMVTAGPCRCYPFEHPMRRYVIAVARLRRALTRGMQGMATKSIGRASLKTKPDGRVAVEPRKKPRDAAHARAMAKARKQRVVARRNAQ